MNSLLGDLRYAFRRARSRLGFTLIAVLSLGLGIGVNTAAFSLVNAIILRKTPIPHANRVIELDLANEHGVVGPISYPDYKDLRDRGNGVFTQFSLSSFTVVPRDMGDHVETLTGQLVNGDYFPLIGLAPSVGRLIDRRDDVSPGAHPVVVLSYGYWQRAFGGDPAVVGKEIRLGARAYTIVGVAPKQAEGLLPGFDPAIYAPVMMINQLEPTTRDELVQRGNHSYFARIRLADGQTVPAARTLVDGFVADMRQQHPGDWTAQTKLDLFPLTGIAVSPMFDNVIVPAATALMAVVALVLIVACANLASFLLAQARDRQREIAIRLAIGASRRSLVRQLLVESLVLAGFGGLIGVAVSKLGLYALLHARLPLPLPINLDAGVDGHVLTFVILASLAAGILFGLLPAIQATRPSVIDTIKNENAGGKPGRTFNMRSALVVAQTATSLLLLVTAALFLRSFDAQSRVDPGFGNAPAGLVWMAIPRERAGEDQLPQKAAEIEARLRQLPGVERVGLVDNILLSVLNQNSETVNVDGFAPPRGTTGFDIDWANADSAFFDAAGIKLVSGRLFSSADGPKTERAAVINEVMAEKFWPGRSAVGRTFRADTIVYRVIGVAKNTKVRSLGEPPRPFVFGAYAQSPRAIFWLVARTKGDATATATAMVAAIRQLDPGLMVVQAKTMQQHLAQMVLPARLGAVAFALFAGLALLLATIGVYGVVRYAVSRRSREVAIRLAIGARPESVVRLLMRDGVTLVIIGAAVGLGLGALMARALQSLLFGIPSMDPFAFIGAPLVLLTVGVLAAFLPARRVARLDPASTLRAE